MSLSQIENVIAKQQHNLEQAKKEQELKTWLLKLRTEALVKNTEEVKHVR